MELPTFERVRRQFLERLGREVKEEEAPPQASGDGSADYELKAGPSLQEFLRSVSRFGIPSSESFPTFTAFLADKEQGHLQFEDIMDLMKRIWTTGTSRVSTSSSRSALMITAPGDDDDDASFVWPAKEMANYEFGRTGGDMRNVCVCIDLPKLTRPREITALKELIGILFCRLPISPPVRVQLPKNSTTGGLKGVLFVELSSPREAEIACMSLQGFAFPKAGNGVLEMRGGYIDLYRLRARPFRNYSRAILQHGQMDDNCRGKSSEAEQPSRKSVMSGATSCFHPLDKSTPPLSPLRKSKSVVVKLRRLQQSLLENLAVVGSWPESILPKWISLEEALTLALSEPSPAGSSAEESVLKVEVKISDMVTAMLSAAQPDGRHPAYGASHLNLETVNQLLSMVAHSGTPRPLALRMHSLLTMVRTLILLDLIASASVRTSGMTKKLEYSQHRISSYLEELSHADAKIKALEEQLFTSQLHAEQEQLLRKEQEQRFSAETEIENISSKSVGQWMALGDAKLLSVQTDLEVSLSRLKTARQELSRQHQELEQRDSLCCICRERLKSILLLPCRHFCLCSECSDARPLTHCPVCRTSLTEKLKVYG